MIAPMDQEPRKALARWIRHQHEQLFPKTLFEALVFFARAERRQSRAGKGRGIAWTTKAFLRQLDQMKNDADLRRFVLDSGRLRDAVRVSCLLLGLEELVVDLPAEHFAALNNKLVLKPSVLHCLEYVP